MHLLTPVCPECGGDVVGIVEQVRGLAALYPPENGEYEYAGGTDVWWDSQQPATNQSGEVRVVCENHHEWDTLIDEERKERDVHHQ